MTDIDNNYLHNESKHCPAEVYEHLDELRSIHFHRMYTGMPSYTDELQISITPKSLFIRLQLGREVYTAPPTKKRSIAREVIADIKSLGLCEWQENYFNNNTALLRDGCFWGFDVKLEGDVGFSSSGLNGGPAALEKMDGLLEKYKRYFEDKVL